MMDKSKSEPERNTFFGVETRQAASWPSGANKDDFNNNFQNLFLKMN